MACSTHSFSFRVVSESGRQFGSVEGKRTRQSNQESVENQRVQAVADLPTDLHDTPNRERRKRVVKWVPRNKSHSFGVPTPARAEKPLQSRRKSDSRPHRADSRQVTHVEHYSTGSPEPQRQEREAEVPWNQEPGIEDSTGGNRTTRTVRPRRISERLGAAGHAGTGRRLRE
jgi:hypothetical protein